MKQLQLNFNLTREEVLERLVKLAEAGVGSGHICLARVGLALSLTAEQMDVVLELAFEAQHRYVCDGARILRRRLSDVTETQSFFFDLIDQMPQDINYARHKRAGGRDGAAESLHRFVEAKRFAAAKAKEFAGAPLLAS